LSTLRLNPNRRTPCHFVDAQTDRATAGRSSTRPATAL